jgi:hypothetical protein
LGVFGVLVKFLQFVGHAILSQRRRGRRVQPSMVRFPPISSKRYRTQSVTLP